MSSSNWRNTSGTSPIRPVKQEPLTIPSPADSCVTTATTLLRPVRPPSPAPSCSTVLFGGSNRGQISLRSLADIVDPDDQMSTVSAPTPSTALKTGLPSKTAQSTAAEDPNDWRFSMKCVGDRLKYILENDDKYQDVVFEVKGSTSNQNFRAHKLILRIASPVFDRIFQEAENSRQDVISVRDVEPNTFKLLLKFIYTDTVEVTGFTQDDVLPLLQAARIYGVRQLYLACVDLLKMSMSDDIAVKLCEMAVSFGDGVLQDVALNHIANKAFQIFPSEAFLQLGQENVLTLFKRNDLRIDEVTLFEAALKWGEHNCIQQGIDINPANLRKVMQYLIPEIRFPLMKADEFTLLVVPTKLLSHEEIVEVYMYVSVATTKQATSAPNSFKTTPRLSQKSLDLDSGSSSSDYRDGSSASPEQGQSRASVTECLDITTTEAESETASNVSTYSDTRKNARKYERSLSHSSSVSSKKRRKVEKEKSGRKSIEQTAKPIPLDDLFGDFDNNSIVLENTAIFLNNFVRDCSRHERRHEVETIKLENVKIEDSNKLEGLKVHFPRLKTFSMNINIEESICSIISDKYFELQKYLFFDIRHSPWSYERLWKTGIDITVVINKVIVLRMSHENGHVVLNKFCDAPTILRSLKEQSVRSLVYSHTHFTDKHFPLSLSRMVILGVVSSQCMSSFIQQFKHLKELTVVSPVGSNARALTLDTEFSSKDKIRKLGLGSFKLHLEPTIRFYNIVVLSLWRVSWESYFEEKFHHTFPKLQELYLIGPVKGSSKLLKNILKIGSLTEFVSWYCDFRLSETSDGNEMRKFLTATGLVESEKSFALKKKSDGKGWTGSKITMKHLNNCIYNQFEYEYLYEDLSTFTNTS